MHKNSQLLGIRVSAFRLILAATIVAVPGLASFDRTAAAGVTPTVAATANTAEAAIAEVRPAEIAPAVAPAASVFDAPAWAEVEGEIDPTVLRLALEASAAAVARGDARDPETLSVIDFSKPSTEPRLWVYDLRSRELLFKEHVSHGRNSGHNMTTSFSNQPESNKSSLGLFRMAEGYFGKHGYSLRLDGLEPGVNDRARARAIVIHGAAYVNAEMARKQGRLGRSLGCPAVRQEIASELIDAVKEDGLLFAYYPDPNWLSESTYLN